MENYNPISMSGQGNKHMKENGKLNYGAAAVMNVNFGKLPFR